MKDLDVIALGELLIDFTENGTSASGNPILEANPGDTFMACVINYVLKHGIDNLSEEDLIKMQQFAGNAASPITTRKGALKVMPAKEEVENG